MRIPPIADQVSAVLVGRFNPAIFSPAWFAMYDIVGRLEAENANVDLIHPEFCRFQIGDFTIQIEPQKFSVSCTGSRHEMVRDLVLSTFGTYLSHTPIFAAGINREIHFDTGDFKIREAVGETLAPKIVWGEWANELASQPEFGHSHGGLMRITMRSPTIAGEFEGLITAEVQPSLLKAIASTGIFVAINQHFDIKQPDDGGVTKIDRLITLLEKQWDVAIEKADFIVDQVQRLVDLAKRPTKVPDKTDGRAA